MESEQKSVEQFIKESNIVKDLYVDILRTLITNYKNENKRQHSIRACIMLWEKKYPLEKKKFKEQFKKFKETRANKFASDTQKQDTRHTFKFPETLWARIDMIVKEPPFLSQSNPMTKEEMDEWAWIIKEFPQYVVAEVY